MNSLFMGNFKAAFSGKGIEFQGFREYSYGDDARYIDWSVSSREQSTVIRKYREEKQWNILCVFDIRESTNYGEGVKKKLYQEILALLFQASKLSGGNFGGYILDADGEHYTHPKKSEISLHQLEKLSEKYKQNNTVLSLDFLLKNPMKRSVIFVVSDNLNIDEKSFRQSALKHDVVFVHISSHFENTLEWQWISRLQTSQNFSLSIDLDDEKKRKIYKKKRQEKLLTFSQTLKKYKIDSVFIDEGKSIFTEFLKLMKQREQH